MSEIDLKIGGRNFKVVCADGEEDSLIAAGSVLDNEAQFIIDQVGQVSESRMLLMAGLMLADRMSAQIETERAFQQKIADHRNEIEHLQSEIAKQSDEMNRADTLTSDERRDLDALQNSAKVDAVQIEQLNTKLEAQNQEIGTLQAALTEAEAKLVETAALVSGAEQRISDAESEAVSAKAALETLLEEITTRIETLAGRAENRLAQTTQKETTQKETTQKETVQAEPATQSESQDN